MQDNQSQSDSFRQNELETVLKLDQDLNSNLRGTLEIIPDQIDLIEQSRVGIEQIAYRTESQKVNETLLKQKTHLKKATNHKMVEEQ